MCKEVCTRKEREARGAGCAWQETQSPGRGRGRQLTCSSLKGEVNLANTLTLTLTCSSLKGEVNPANPLTLTLTCSSVKAPSD